MEPSLSRFLQQLKNYGQAKNIPNISLESGAILQFFVQLIGARNILEIGSANGLSTIFLAEAIQTRQGKVVTCDVSKPSFQKAQENLEAVGLSSFVDFRFGDGIEILRAHEIFDFIFIDAEKKRTPEFFTAAATHLAPDGLIIIDDTAKFPEKMSGFTRLRGQEKSFCFFDIPVDGDDTMTVAFRGETL